MFGKTSDPLRNIKVASPCRADWDAMYGTDRVRYCGDCKLNVYNLSGMRRVDAERLIASVEGRLCVRFYRRADGTVLTKDCPVGLAAVRAKLSRVATAVAGLVLGLFTGSAVTMAFDPTPPLEVLKHLPDYHAPAPDRVDPPDQEQDEVDPQQGSLRQPERRVQGRGIQLS